MELKYKINGRVLIIALIGALMVCSSYLMFVYNPLQLIVKKMLALAPGTIFYNIWLKPPYDIYINVYIFNVTNEKEFLEGKEKLNFEQVGPYAYKEILVNTNVTVNPNGTITYHPKRYLEFNRERSVGDADTDRLLSPNIPLIGIAASLRDSLTYTLAISSISSFLNSPRFVNVTVSEYLWGYDDPLVTLAHDTIPSWINFERFGIMDRLMALDNGSNIVTITNNPSLGVSSNPLLNDEEKVSLYHIDRFNGSPGLSQWGYEDVGENETSEANTVCNTLEGSFDGTIFPNNIRENRSFYVYRRAFCRRVPTHYEGKGYDKNGFEAFHYRVDENFLARKEDNPDNECYCQGSDCLPRGLGSIASCYYDIPITLSQPHFLNADPTLLEQVGGMKPNKSIHDTTFALHPQLGVPLDGQLRIQINLAVGETQFNSIVKPFNNLHLPLFWLELVIDDIPSIVYILIKLVYEILPIAQIILMYLLGILGLAMISASALLALFFSNDSQSSPLNALGYKHSYSPIPILPIAQQYFKPDIRISK